jgi:TolA-binding protein|tara:strand:+ start:1311 stop:1574 length:264 start_codon:yes stop_codon:yes gene_type:complete
MDLNIIDQYGLPIAITIAFGYFIWKQQTWIQNELVDDLEQQFRRLEGIIIKLIDQQKITQMDLKQVKGYIEGIEDILSRLMNGEPKK